MKKHKIICIGGPSGVGKDTIVTAFLKQNPEYVRVPRSTTRPPRHDEKNGVHYYFLTRQEFEEKTLSGDIVARDTFCDESYGIDIMNIRRAAREGNGIIGVFGICSVELRALLEEEISLVYVIAPLEVLEKRLIERGDSPENIRLRLDAAKKQLVKEPHQFDYLLCNMGDIQVTLSELRRFFE